MSFTQGSWSAPRTKAVRRALRVIHDAASVSDLLFLEAWELHATHDIADTLRAGQIRRANPQLVLEIRAELGIARPIGARPH